MQDKILVKKLQQRLVDVKDDVISAEDSCSPLFKSG